MFNITLSLSIDLLANSNIWEFFRTGGPFMIPLGLCSIIALMCIVFKLISLKVEEVIPRNLAHRIEAGVVLSQDLRRDKSILDRLCALADEHAEHKSGDALRLGIEAQAREELVHLQSGIPVLEVIITIAPLLGILGTASGLVTVFANIGNEAAQQRVAMGIGEALSTTIVGLAIAVPCVVAHVGFSRKIERMAARLEVLLDTYLAQRHQPNFTSSTHSQES